MDMRGYYRTETAGEGVSTVYSIYKWDGSFGSCNTVPNQELRGNLVALGEQGYRPLPCGWTAIDIKLMLAMEGLRHE